METAVETGIEDTLTDRQQLFVLEYLQDLNASAAAERAGYSARTRASQGGELMRNPAVRERIRLEMESLFAKLRCSALDLMKERQRTAFFHAGRFFDASGRLLGFEEMETDVRNSLVISGKWRKGVPEVRFRQRNPEPALRALERVHERLEKLNEKHYAALEKERGEVSPPEGQGAEPRGMWAGLNLDGAAPVQAAAEEAVVEAVTEETASGGQVEVPGEAAQPAPAAPVDNFAENSQVFSGLATTTVVETAAPTTSVVDTPPVAAAPNLNPGAPLIKRHDPDLMWGGKHGPTPAAEPSPALQEHLMRVRHAEMTEEVRRDMEARGGRIKPGNVRPQGLPPGYNPPWLRDDRPQFAIGAGECSLDD